MFDISPMDLLVLAIVGVLVLGPERLPGLARDAARMLRTIRDLANGTRSQLQDEFGPQLTEIGMIDLNPRKAFARLLAEAPDETSTNQIAPIAQHGWPPDEPRLRDSDAAATPRRSPLPYPRADA
jgi:sec-independent protein translocase protein TatB